jgi:integrase
MLQKLVVRKHRKDSEPHYYLRLQLDGKERMTVLCTCREADQHPDRETFLHHRIVEGVIKLHEFHNKPREERKPKGPTCEEVSQQWLESLTVADRTLVAYRAAIGIFCEFCGSTPLEEIKSTSTRNMIRSLTDSGKAPNTIRSYVRMSQIMLHYAAAEGLIASAPTLEMPTRDRKNIRIYQESDLDRIESYLRDAPDKRNRYRLVMLLRYLGLRAGEVWALPLRHIDLKNRTLAIQKVPEISWSPKKSKEALLPLRGDLLKFLEEDLKRRDIREVWYLDKGQGQQAWAEVTGLNHSLMRTLKKLGLQNAAKTLHGYRASAITKLLEAGIPPHEVQAIARHDDLSTTLGYLHHKGVSERAVAALQSNS